MNQRDEWVEALLNSPQYQQVAGVAQRDSRTRRSPRPDARPTGRRERSWPEVQVPRWRCARCTATISLVKVNDTVRRVRTRLGQIAADAEDARALAALGPLQGSALPWTTFSMRPAAISTVTTDIILNRRAAVVECGSGNSTLYVARLLREVGSGHLTSIEHDAGWASVTSRLLEREGLGGYVTLVHAPLEGGWYRTDSIPEIGSIDLLVVDGPPSHPPKSETARTPAFHHFRDRLTDDATVILDDAKRPGERRVVAEWEAASGRRFSITSAGVAVSARYTS